jgi:hypothetical protein
MTGETAPPPRGCLVCTIVYVLEDKAKSVAAGVALGRVAGGEGTRLDGERLTARLCAACAAHVTQLSSDYAIALAPFLGGAS